MNEKVKKLLEKGFNEQLALLLAWDYFSGDEKSILTLEQCQWVWQNTPSGSPEKTEAWALVKAKAETFEQCQWVWQNTPSGSPEEAEALTLVKAKAETLEQCQWVWENTPSGSPEKTEAWALVKAKAQELLKAL